MFTYISHKALLPVLLVSGIGRNIYITVMYYVHAPLHA